MHLRDRAVLCNIVACAAAALLAGATTIARAQEAPAPGGDGGADPFGGGPAQGGTTQAPLEHRISEFANMLRTGKKRVLVLGDSIWSEDATPRLSLGVRNTWAIDFFGWTAMATPTVTDVLAAVRYANYTPTVTPVVNAPAFSPPYAWNATALQYNPANPLIPIPLGTSPSYPLASPKAWSEFRFNGDHPDGVALWSVTLLGGRNGGPDHLAQFRNGNWLSPRMTGRIIYYNDPVATLRTLDVLGYRHGVQVGGARVETGSDKGVKHFDVPLPGAGEPMLVVTSDGNIEQPYVGPPPRQPSSSLAILGAHFENAIAESGISLTVLANAGWTASAHVSPTVISDDSLRGYLAAVNIPDLVIIQVGANVSYEQPNPEITPQSTLSPQWRANIQGIIDRYRRLLNDLDPRTPRRFLLVAPYDLGPMRPWGTTQASVLYDIAASNDDVSFLNLYALAGPWVALTTQYLYDGVHPNIAGANYFPRIIWQALSGGLVGSPAIILHPTPQVAVPGSGAAFNVVAVGLQPLNYRWRKNGVPLQNGGNISGATTDTLVVEPATIADVADYDCVVTNTISSATSDPAALTVFCFGDTNGDGLINFADLNAVLTQFGQAGHQGTLSGDVNFDGRVDFRDLTIVLSNFGLDCGFVPSQGPPTTP